MSIEIPEQNNRIESKKMAEEMAYASDELRTQAVESRAKAASRELGGSDGMHSDKIADIKEDVAAAQFDDGKFREWLMSRTDNELKEILTDLIDAEKEARKKYVSLAKDGAESKQAHRELFWWNARARLVREIIEMSHHN